MVREIDDWEETTQLNDVIETRFIPPKEIQEKKAPEIGIPKGFTFGCGLSNKHLKQVHCQISPSHLGHLLTVMIVNPRCRMGSLVVTFIPKRFICRLVLDIDWI